MKDNEIRCGKCNRMLAKGQAGNITIKCPRCGTMNHMRAESPGRESHIEDHSEKYSDTDWKR